MHAWKDTEYTLKNSIEFPGHWIPTDVEIWNQGVVVMTAHLDGIELVKQPEEVAFQMPADAVLHDKSNITVPAELAEGLLLKRVDPVYPPIAFEARVEGVVVAHMVIGKDGHPRDVHAIAGPPMLRQAAIDAISQWIYRPYMLNGAPVAVETTIFLNFSLRRR
jgi:outer membrane biosynthesis protein TonB